MSDTVESLKFYTDKHIPKSVALQLRSRGVDVVRCEEVGLAQADDETHLRYATQQNRAVVTRDTDFLRLHSQWMQQGNQHSGIMFLHDYLQGEGSVGPIVKELFSYYELVMGSAATIEKDVANQVIYVG